MDGLVKGGVELDQHYVQPVCTPTRTALMSGRYPGRFGPQALAPSNLRAMPLGTLTMASFLKAHGYRTHQCGKWHLGARPEWIPNAYGFDTSYGTLTGAADPWTHFYREGSVYKDTWHRDGKLFQEEGNATELVAERSIYIAKKGERSLRRGEWKLIAGNKGKVQLFRIGEDPLEKREVSGEHPEKVAELRGLMEAEMAKDNMVLPEDLEGMPE